MSRYRLVDDQGADIVVEYTAAATDIRALWERVRNAIA